MNFHPVDSQAIQAIEHDPATNEVKIHWKSGGISSHTIPAAKVKRFLAAPSKGKFYHKEIRDQHPGTKAA